MMDPGETMNREEIAAFLASLKKLRDGLDDFKLSARRYRRRWDAAQHALPGNRRCLSCRCGGISAKACQHGSRAAGTPVAT